MPPSPSPARNYLCPPWQNIPEVPLYRGYVGEKPWLSRTIPAFTDVRAVAEGYAQSDGGSVREFRLNIRRPLVLGDLQEDVVEMGSLRALLAIPREAFDSWMLQFSSWRLDGDWVDPSKTPPAQREHLYTDTYAVANDPWIVAAARRAGFDGLLYRAIFASAICENPGGSYDRDTFTVIEIRPFFPAQIHMPSPTTVPLDTICPNNSFLFGGQTWVRLAGSHCWHPSSSTLKRIPLDTKVTPLAIAPGAGAASSAPPAVSRVAA